MHENTKSLKETKTFLESFIKKFNINEELVEVADNAVVKYEDLYKIDLKIMKFLKTDVNNIDINDLNKIINFYNVTAEISNLGTEVSKDIDEFVNDYIPEDWYDESKKIDLETMPESPSRIKTKEDQEFDDFWM